tara:strand:+ start:22 stop:1440 length:1419 start_codon:yes stop_codon:yes gene_type:complete
MSDNNNYYRKYLKYKKKYLILKGGSIESTLISGLSHDIITSPSLEKYICNQHNIEPNIIICQEKEEKIIKKTWWLMNWADCGNVYLGRGMNDFGIPSNEDNNRIKLSFEKNFNKFKEDGYNIKELFNEGQMVFDDEDVNYFATEFKLTDYKYLPNIYFDEIIDDETEIYAPDVFYILSNNEDILNKIKKMKKIQKINHLQKINDPITITDWDLSKDLIVSNLSTNDDWVLLKCELNVKDTRYYPYKLSESNKRYNIYQDGSQLLDQNYKFEENLFNINTTFVDHQQTTKYKSTECSIIIGGKGTIFLKMFELLEKIKNIGTNYDFDFSKWNHNNGAFVKIQSLNAINININQIFITAKTNEVGCHDLGANTIKIRKKTDEKLIKFSDIPLLINSQEIEFYATLNYLQKRNYIIANINDISQKKKDLISNRDKQFIYYEPQKLWGWTHDDPKGMNKNGRKQEFMFNPLILNLK